MGQNKAISSYADSEAIGCDLSQCDVFQFEPPTATTCREGNFREENKHYIPPHKTATDCHTDSITIRDASKGQLLSVNQWDGGKAPELLLISEPSRVDNRKMPRETGMIPGRHWDDDVPHALPQNSP